MRTLLDVPYLGLPYVNQILITYKVNLTQIPIGIGIPRLVCDPFNYTPYIVDQGTTKLNLNLGY